MMMMVLRSQPASSPPLWRLDPDVGRSPDLRRLQPASQAVRALPSSAPRTSTPALHLKS